MYCQMPLMNLPMYYPAYHWSIVNAICTVYNKSSTHGLVLITYYLTLLHSERPTLYTILAFLSAIG